LFRGQARTVGREDRGGGEAALLPFEAHSDGRLFSCPRAGTTVCRAPATGTICSSAFGDIEGRHNDQITARHPHYGPPGERSSWPQRWQALRRVWGVPPFVLADVLRMLVLIAFPVLTLWLPQLLKL